jgi:hypothetical protein
MTGLDYAAWFVLCLLAVIIIGVVFFIGNLPGSVAKKRNHPNVDAIVMGSWATLIFGVVLWPLVLMWAYSPNLFNKRVVDNREGEA